MNQVGIVAIGRNEGDRLCRCLDSVVRLGHTVVYVDSGSTDGSIELARVKGVEVVELDMAQPFTMARGRNAGFARLEAIVPDVRFVQFVDGDCEVVAGWLDQAHAAIESRPNIAAVSGRRRERFPDRSIYNRIADIEWQSPNGEAKFCGGDVLIRAEAFQQIGGYNPTLIAGEDPELSVRLRQHGWTILRIDAEMTLHDMAMTRFSRWWKRGVRSGFAFAEGAAMHGKPPERHWVQQVRSIQFWGILLPLVIVVLAGATRGVGLVLALAYPLQLFRIARHYRKVGMPWRFAWLYSGACVLGRFPNAVGAVRYWTGQLLGRRQALIEYKSAF
jgi:cellulose synthase/poly-beta-1,6-N-acetylglucosamine synthase-like glycosyltransferase